MFVSAHGGAVVSEVPSLGDWRVGSRCKGERKEGREERRKGVNSTGCGLRVYGVACARVCAFACACRQGSAATVTHLFMFSLMY